MIKWWNQPPAVLASLLWQYKAEEVRYINAIPCVVQATRELCSRHSDLSKNFENALKVVRILRGTS